MSLTRLDDLFANTDFGFGYVPDITELSVARTGGVTWLYGHTSNADDGFVTMRMSNSGDLTYVANTGFTGPSIFRSYDESDPTGFDGVTVDGQFYLVGSGFFEVEGDDVDHGLHYYSVQSNGELAEVGRFDRNPNTKQVSEVINVDGQVLTFEVSGGNNGNYNTLYVNDFEIGFDNFRIEQSGTPPSFQNADVFGLAKDDGDAFFFYTRADNNRISWISFSSSGTGKFQNTIAGSGDLGAAGVASDMESVSFGDQGFLITTNAKRGLASYDIDDFGGVKLADTVGRSNKVADWESSEIATFSFEGRNYVVTAGKDIAVFEISDEGEFFQTSKIDYNGDADGAHDIEVHAQGGNVYIAASDDTGVSSFEFVPGLPQNANGTSGDDIMIGDSRDNRFSGFKGADKIKGAAGDDVLYGNTGNDQLFGGNGSDKLFGAEGKDKLWGDDGNDELNGQAGADVIFGGAGADTLIGGNGNDVLQGGKGADMLFAGPGKDILIGGKGKDTLVGSTKSDTFVFSANGSRDTINDWGDIDLIDMRDFGAGVTFSDLDIQAYQSFGVVISLDDEKINVVNGFNGVDVGDLTADHFLFG